MKFSPSPQAQEAEREAVDAPMQVPDTSYTGGSRPKRVVFYGINSSQGFSGGRYYAWLLAEALAEAGWDVAYITTERPMFCDDFADTALFPAHDKIQLHLCPIRGSRECVLPDIPCDILFIVPHSGDDTAMYKRGLRFAAKQRARVALLSFEPPNWFNALAPVQRNPILWDGWKLVSRYASLILSLAAEGTNWARAFYDNAPAGTLFEHLWAPINSRAADAAGDVPKEKRILFLTRFAHAEHKGGGLVPELFCEAMRGYTAVFIVGVGSPDADYMRQVRREAARHGIEIEILHTLSEAEKWREFKRAALVLFPSFFEGFGLPPVEAQVAGTPCITFDLPVLREVSGGNIFYVPPGDTAAMREKAANILNSDTDWSGLRARFGPAAQFDDFIQRAGALFSRVITETKPLHTAAAHGDETPEALMEIEARRGECFGMQPALVAFCPGEKHRIERCLAWYEQHAGPARIYLFALPERMELAQSLPALFPRLDFEIVPYPDCGVEGYYSPEHLPEALAARFKQLRAEGAVLLTGPPCPIRYMPGYMAPAVKKDYNFFRILHRLGITRIWTHDAAGVRKLELPMLLDDLVDRHKGKRAWVMGNGPSLNQIDMSRLKGEVTFGSNRIYLGFEEWGFSTTYWGVLDTLQCERHMREWELNIPGECVKFYPFEYAELFQLENACPVNFFPAGHPDNRTNFMDPLNLAELHKPNNFSRTPDVVYLGHTVIYGLLQIAVIMGCNPIYLLGIDHNYKISEEDRKRGLWSNASSANHFHKGYGKSGGGVHEFQLPEMEKIERSFQFASEWAEANGVLLRNATPGTQLPTVPVIDFEEALARGESARLMPPGPELPRTARKGAVYIRPKKPGATILVCTPDKESALTKTCLDSLAQYTRGVNYELLLFDNGRFGRFQHAREINRALDIAQGDVFVTLDDDVELTEGWLEAMIEEARPDVGIVSCVNLYYDDRYRPRGSVRSAGVWMDYDGVAHHYQQPIETPIAAPASCSCCWLINDRSLRFDLRYEKYYQESDLCLRCWDQGKKVVIVPRGIYHRGQGQMESLGLDMDQIRAISGLDQQRFKAHWIDNGAMARVYEGIKDLVDIPLPTEDLTE